MHAERHKRSQGRLSFPIQSNFPTTDFGPRTAGPLGEIGIRTAIVSDKEPTYVPAALLRAGRREPHTSLVTTRLFTARRTSIRSRYPIISSSVRPNS